MFRFSSLFYRIHSLICRWASDNLLLCRRSIICGGIFSSVHREGSFAGDDGCWNDTNGSEGVETTTYGNEEHCDVISEYAKGLPARQPGSCKQVLLFEDDAHHHRQVVAEIAMIALRNPDGSSSDTRTSKSTTSLQAALLAAALLLYLMMGEKLAGRPLSFRKVMMLFCFVTPHNPAAVRSIIEK
jgi:hypothetical protein